MFYIGIGLLYLVCLVKGIKEYWQMESFLKCKEPVYIESFEPRTLYTDSLNGVTNLSDYQKEV